MSLKKNMEEGKRIGKETKESTREILKNKSVNKCKKRNTTFTVSEIK